MVTKSFKTIPQELITLNRYKSRIKLSFLEIVVYYEIPRPIRILNLYTSQRSFISCLQESGEPT